MDAGRIVESLRRAISATDNARSLISWTGAPLSVGDAVQLALDRLCEAAQVAEDWLEQEKGESTMKEFFELLSAFKASEESVKGAKERVGQIGAVCEKFNAGFDKFQACADGFDGLFDCPEGEAAPNGETGEAVEGKVNEL